MDTFPFVTFRMLKPTVGIISSLKEPVWEKERRRQRGRRRARRLVERTAMTFTSDVLPAAFKPIKESSISSLKNRLARATECQRAEPKCNASHVSHLLSQSRK
jgi:hypothetical protein